MQEGATPMTAHTDNAARAPWWVTVFGPIAKFLLAARVPLGFNGLITVRGRTSGLPRTTPLAIIDVSGRRWVWAPWGEVHWVRNLRVEPAASRSAEEAKKLMDEQVAQLGLREQNLQKELEQLQVNRDELASAVDEIVCARYERLLRNKGENVVVGVQHGVCGGCHMKLPPQLLVACRSSKELVMCINCGRILYYTRDMDLAVAD
jgi:hypothetical protein